MDAGTNMRKNAVLFLTGSTVYPLIELAWRGYTHPSMAAAGGICLPVLDRICNNKNMCRRPIPVRCIAGALSITAVEFCFGIVFNLILRQNVWDYSQMPMNVLGQVCLPYTLLWVLLSFPAIQLCRLLGSHFR